jgi:hypothetical protein
VVHAPQQFRLVAWVVSRYGARPNLPHWNTGNPNEVLLHSEITVDSPRPVNFGSAWQQVAGYYVYCVLTPAEPTVDGAPGVTNGASVIPAFACNAEGFQFVQGIISPLNPSPQGVTPVLPGGT